MKKTRRFTVGSVILFTLVAMTVAPVQAAEPDSGGDTTTTAPAPSPRIVGGVQAPAGAWPSQVALLYSGEPNNYWAQFCGGTVIDPSWILTAAHCLEGAAANQVDVLTGTQSLASGGVRHRAAELRSYPSFDNTTYDGDYGLVRIATPTDAPLQTIAGQSAAIDADVGSLAITTGWGNMDPNAQTYPQDLYQVEVPILSNTTCASAGYGGLITAQMVCAGQSPYFSYDSCQGDSGGPLVVSRSGRWVQVGITSWGSGCAEGYPGVYSRVAARSNWLRAQIRFGPHSNAVTFVEATWRDLYAVAPSNFNLYLSAAAQNTASPVAWLSERIQGSSYQARTGGVARLYRAFFLRDPDTSGMRFWWSKINGSWSLQRIASYFAQSPEFIDRYGSLSNGDYVDLVYQNVLGRAPDPGGRAFWLGQLDSGARNRGEVMVGFSESNEYRHAAEARTDVVITYFGLVRRIPNDSEISAWISQSNSSLIAALFASLEYHRRF